MAANSNSLRGALLATTALVAGAGGAVPMATKAFAQNILPSHGVVTSGAASIGQSGANMTVNQTSSRAVVNWGSFSIGQGNGVTFNQPGATSAILNRVSGSTTSTIAGQLQANGQVYLVNPNGIAITKTGAVQVGGGFVASTLGIADRDFNSGNLNFVGNGASAGVSNAGSIAAGPGGFVGLLGGTVSNSGVISVPLGKVGMGSGEQATLNLTGDNFLQVAVPTDAKTADGQALIDVSGKVHAAGGSVQLKAATVAQAIRNAVNVPGALSVTSARASGGSIILGGGAGGDVSVTGRLKASGRTGGGTIAVSGHDVALRQAKFVASSTKGRGGSATITGTNAVSLASSSVNVSGATGGGSIRIGGDFHGASDLTSAQTTTIDSASTLNASAKASGNGGTVAVWSDAMTNFAGRITATGSPSGGDGGYVEVSANPTTHGVLSYSGFADLTAPKGKTGTLLLDPFNITICLVCDDVGGSFSDGVYMPIATSLIRADTVVTQLGVANVVVSTGLTGSPGGDAGNLAVSAPITWASGNSLTLEAANNLSVGAAITATGAGSLTLTGISNITVGADIKTAGGAITFNSPVQVAAVAGGVAVSAGAAGTVAFNSTVDATPAFSGFACADCDLTVSGGSVTFGGNVGSSAPLNGLTVTGSTILAGNVTTAFGDTTSIGNIRFNSPVHLRGDVDVNAGDAAGVFFASTVDSDPAFPSSGLTVNAKAIGLNGASGATNPLGAVTLTAPILIADLFLQSITATGDVALNGIADLKGNITTSGGSIRFTGPVGLESNITFSAPSGTVSFGSTVDSLPSSPCDATCDLTVNAGTISFGGALGGSDPLGRVSLTSTAGGITLNTSITASESVSLSAANDIVEVRGPLTGPTSSGSIVTPTLSATSSAGRVVLTLRNLVDSISGSAPGGFSFFDSSALNVGNAGITSSVGSIGLTAAGSITQTGPVRGLGLFAETAAREGVTGDVILNNPGNEIGTLAGGASGSFQFANGAGAGLTIGTVNYFISSGTETPSSATGSGVASVATAVPGAEIQISTPGNLVLDSPVQGSIPDGLIVLAATGNFINNVGPAAVVDPWQIYSATPTGDVFGGLDSGNTAVWNTTFGEPVTAPGNRYIFAFQPTITITSGDLAKSYGQDVTALVAGDFTIAGLQPGVDKAFLPDTAAAVYSGTPSVTSLGSPARASVAGSPYPITVAPGSFTVSDRYALVLDSAGRLAIDPLPLTYAVADATSTYGTTATLGAATLFGVLVGDVVDPTVGAFLGATQVAVGPRTPVGVYSQEVTALSSPDYFIAPSGNTSGTLTIDPLAITYSVADANSIFGTTPILGLATLFGVLPGDTVDPTVGAFRGTVQVPLSPLTPVGSYAQRVTAITNPNYVIAVSGNAPGTLTVVPTTVAIRPFDPGFVPALTQINNPAQTESDVGGYEQVLPHFTVACNEPPSLPDPNGFSDPDQALRAISQSMENHFRRCQNATQSAIGDALDAYAAKLQVLAPRLPAALRNVPTIVAEGAKRVRAARSRTEAIAVLRQTVAAVRKEIALVLSEDPQTRSREVRDGDVIAGALDQTSVALVNSGGL